MWIRLKKSLQENKKRFPIGRLMNKSTDAARELVESGHAEYYNGPRPPTEKIKTDFFKPKIK